MIIHHSRVYSPRTKFKITKISNQVIIDRFLRNNHNEVGFCALKKAFNGEALLYLTAEYKSKESRVIRSYKISFFRVGDSGRVVVTKDGFRLSNQLQGDQQGIIKQINQVYVTGKHGNIILLRFNSVYMMVLTFSPNGTKKLLSRSIANLGMTKNHIWRTFWMKQTSPDSKFLFIVHTYDTIHVKKFTEDHRLEHRAEWRTPVNLRRNGRWENIPTTGTFKQICCYSETRLIALISFFGRRYYQKLYALDYSDEDRSFSFYPISDKCFTNSSERRLYRLDGKVYMNNGKNDVFRIEI